MKKFFIDFLTKFNDDDTMTLAASLAFWAALSIAPIVVIFLSLTSSMSLHLQQAFITEANHLVGERAGTALQMIIESAKQKSNVDSFSGLFGLITLIISASAVFGELKSSLNKIMFSKESLEDKDDSNLHIVLQFIEIRILNIGLFLSFILILVISLIFSSILSMYEPEGNIVLIRLCMFLLTAFLYTVLFSLAYKYIPQNQVLWRQALIAGLITTVLFLVGKEVIGLYLGNSAIGASYGSAGSVIVLLTWIFYSTLVIFSGAQISVLVERRLLGQGDSHAN